MDKKQKPLEIMEQIDRRLTAKNLFFSIIPYLLVIWILKVIFDTSFIYSALFLAAVSVSWYLFRLILNIIFYHLFLKKDATEKFIRYFESKEFPEPENYEIDHPELFLESIMSKDDYYPQNVFATSLLSELRYARSAGQYVIVWRMESVLKDSLRMYKHTLKKNSRGR
jgi:predicted membrane protein